MSLSECLPTMDMEQRSGPPKTCCSQVKNLPSTGFSKLVSFLTSRGTPELALAKSAKHGRCPLLRLLYQERVPKRQENLAHPQHHLLHPTFKSVQLHGCSNHREDVAQRSLAQSRGTNPQQRSTDGHLASNNGNPSPLQRLRARTPRIRSTLPHGLPSRSISVESLPPSLGGVGGAQPPRHHLALCAPWRSCV